MKICVSTTTGGLDDEVSPLFGRCPNFTIVETEGKQIINTQVLDNPYSGAAGGAGIQAAQYVANQGCAAAIAGNYGPNSFPILHNSGVEVITSQGISVRDAVNKYLNGELKAQSQATGPRYGGMGGGMGAGGGRGMGRGMGRAMRFTSPPTPQAPSQPQSREDEIQNLEEEAFKLEEQLKKTKEKINKLSDDK
ncbi:MAG: dinitrogenase iron-molybdenum cofactor biosynthesis protein [Candidatus Altiarchaeales archaeon ex4484_96]|nr:MAG: dinitrogenase iron-molybdenum cofactor biosynthesis protein [Candidatus Altiarchaeales archaeon ex4484_96]